MMLKILYAVRHPRGGVNVHRDVLLWVVSTSLSVSLCQEDTLASVLIISLVSAGLSRSATHQQLVSEAGKLTTFR